MMSIDIISLISSIIQKYTNPKAIFLIAIIFLVLFIIPINNNLTILHLEYKRIDITKFKVIPFLKPFVTNEESVYLKEFKSASLHKANFRLSPYWKLKLGFENPDTTITIPFRRNLPYKIHYHLYYKLNHKCSADIPTTIDAVLKFYPYFEFKKSFDHVEYRYLVFLSYVIGYFIFSLILPFLIN